MNKENLVIINNEKVFSDNGNFFCENLDLKVVPEGLNNFFNVRFIVRKSNKKGNQKINLKNIDIAPNIFSFILFVIKSLKNNSKYLIISITPYTFLAYIILFIFNKKVFLYLWSDGHEEWKYLLGKWSVWIFRIMYVICTFRSEIIICNKRLSKKKSHLISISRLDESWFLNRTKPLTESAIFLYVGRLSKEKGIFNFIDMLNATSPKTQLLIAGNSKNFNFENSKVKLLGYIPDAHSLIKAYDKCNITILPSFTEGYPYVVDESLARVRPVIIFEEISYVINNKKGIFVCKRNAESLEKTTNYILNNYDEIQRDIRENKLPTKKSMLKQISDIIRV